MEAPRDLAIYIYLAITKLYTINLTKCFSPSQMVSWAVCDYHARQLGSTHTTKGLLASECSKRPYGLRQREAARVLQRFLAQWHPGPHTSALGVGGAALKKQSGARYKGVPFIGPWGVDSSTNLFWAFTTSAECLPNVAAKANLPAWGWWRPRNQLGSHHEKQEWSCLQQQLWVTSLFPAVWKQNNTYDFLFPVSAIK